MKTFAIKNILRDKLVHCGQTTASLTGRSLNMSPIHQGRAVALVPQTKGRQPPVKMSGFQKENDAAKSLFRRLEVFSLMSYRFSLKPQSSKLPVFPPCDVII